MSNKIIGRRLRGACVTAAALAAFAPAAFAPASANAKTSSSTSQMTAAEVAAAEANCTPPAVTQPFLPFGDANEYALVPGQSCDNFSGSGWSLSDGASIVSATLYDGSSGNVLLLPAGASAVSPPMCITNQDPTARAMIRDVAGSAGVDITVTYLGPGGSSTNTGNIKGSAGTWSLARTVNIHPSSVSGWQLAQFTFTPHGDGSSEYQIYNFYADPRMAG